MSDDEIKRLLVRAQAEIDQVTATIDKGVSLYIDNETLPDYYDRITKTTDEQLAALILHESDFAAFVRILAKTALEQSLGRVCEKEF